MNTIIPRRILFIALLILLVTISACGTFEVGLEPINTPTLEGEGEARATQSLAADESGEAEPEVTRNVVEEATPEPSPTPTAEVTHAITETVDAAPSEITRIDDNWSHYTNYKLGFSINFPNVKTHAFGACAWVEENGDHSYRPRYSHVPVAVFEGENAVYITSEYQHVLSGETKETREDGGTRIFYSECEAVSNSLELLQDPDTYQEKWEIVVEQVQDDAELEAFIKERYGNGCSLGAMIASNQEGVLDVTIQGDGKQLPQTECPINFGTVVKYYPAGNKVAAWDTGQAYTFSADVNNEVTYDQEMIDSFRFLTGDMQAGEGIQSKNDYSDWMPYHNEVIGYSLMVPQDMTVIDPDPSQKVHFSGPEVDGIPWPLFTIEHYQSNNPEDDEFLLLVEAYASYLETAEGFPGLIQELTIGGYPAMQFRYVATGQSDARDDYYFPVDDLMFRISIIHAGGREDDDLYHQFLRSIEIEGS